jgi:hypothetical protein
MTTAQIDMLTACAEIDRLHRELAEAQYGSSGQATVNSLIKVLEWYADPTNYNSKSGIELDKGTRARIVLAEVKRI